MLFLLAEPDCTEEREKMVVYIKTSFKFFHNHADNT